MVYKHKIGLVLGGGGARGIVHLGVVKAMLEKNTPPDIISGVSAGAIIGVMLAAGSTPEQIFEKVKSYSFSKFSKIILPKTGLFSLLNLKEILRKEIKYSLIEELPMEFWIAASNITLGRIEYFNTGLLLDTIIASCSIPVIFEPIKIGTYDYVDGGLFDNLPIEPLKGICKNIIAVNLTPSHKTQSFDNLFQVAFRTFHLSIEANTMRNKAFCDIVIEPKELYKYDMLQLNQADCLFDLGYSEGLKALENMVD